jgi:hypothetical protein
MTDILSHTHSGLRWVVLLLLLAVLVTAFGGLGGKKEFTEGNRKTALFAMIAYHLQWTIGLVLYFTSPLVSFAEGFMKDTNLRFYGVEHIAGMTIAMVLITIGHKKAKDASRESRARFKSLAVFYGISLLVILASIPWPFRIAGAGWF